MSANPRTANSSNANGIMYDGAAETALHRKPSISNGANNVNFSTNYEVLKQNHMGVRRDLEPGSKAASK